MSNANLGDYTISAVDGGKATSIVSTANSSGFAVGTVGADGRYFPLSFSIPLVDVALAPSGQLYGINGVSNSNVLFRLDPSLSQFQQITEATKGVAIKPTFR